MEFHGDYLLEWANDLGKSEDFIEKLQEYVSRLETADLPIIFSPLHWAKLMGMNYSDVLSILSNRNAYYNQFRIKKKRGGFRHIDAPNPQLYNIQNWIKGFILDQVKFPKEITSYQKGKSIIDNAKPHVNKELIVKFDLKDFFRTVTEDRVFGIFRMLGYNKAVAIDLSKACCIDIPEEDTEKKLKYPLGCLPQGAPSSPALSNLSAVKMDYRLIAYAKSKNLDYTRYADDITLSGKVSDKPSLWAIKQMVKDDGFMLNILKTKYVHRSNQQIVTGLTVNERLSIPKRDRKQIHTHLHNCINFGPYHHLGRMKIHKRNYREWLLGNIVYIQMIHPKEGRLLREKFDLINWFDNSN